MRLLRIEPLPRECGSYLLHFEDGSSRKVYDKTLLQFGLHADMELSEAQIEQLARDSAAGHARTRAAAMIGRRAYSKKELGKKLSEKGVDSEAARDAADWLEEIGAINDMQYAESVVRHYCAKGHGERRIREELYRRGVEKELWEEALLQAPPPEEAIDRYISGHLRGEKPDRKELKRISDGLYRRGFGWADISAGLRRFGEEHDD